MALTKTFVLRHKLESDTHQKCKCSTITVYKLAKKFKPKFYPYFTLKQDQHAAELLNGQSSQTQTPVFHIPCWGFDTISLISTNWW